MDIIIGKYIETNSWIHKLDPRTKLICAFILILITFLISELVSISIFLLGILLLVISSKVSIIKFIQGLKPLMFILAFTVIFQIAFNNDGDILTNVKLHFSVYNFVIAVPTLILYLLIRKFYKKSFIIFLMFLALTVYIFTLAFPTNNFYLVEIRSTGVITAAYLLIRIISLVFISSLLTLTTKPLDLNSGIESILKPLKVIKVPAEEIAMMISIALRFIPTLLEESQKIIKAQSSRGVDFKESKLSSKVMQIISLLIPMFIISLKRADDLSNAMIARAYIPGKKRTKLHVLKYRLIDYFCLVLVLSLSVLVIFI